MHYIVKKIITLTTTLLLITLLTFTAFAVIPSDAAQARLGTEATPQQVEALREEMALNDPVLQRYGNWLTGALQGDFGQSYQYDGVQVSDMLAERLPTTALLAGLSFLLILVISLPLGILCARFRGSFLDGLITQLTQITMAIPSFFLGILLTYIFGLVLRLFQPGAFVAPTENLGQSLYYLLFPALAVAIPKIAMVVKFLRGAILGEIQLDYVRTARSKGNREGRVLYVHVLRNAFLPVLTFLALIIADIMAGSIVVEQVFSVPGIGRLLITAISGRDYPVVQAVVTYITVIVLGVNFLVDMLYPLIDPRMRSAYAGPSRRQL